MADPIPVPGWWVMEVTDPDVATPVAVHAADEDAAWVRASIILGLHPDAEVVVMSGRAGAGARRVRTAVRRA